MKIQLQIDILLEKIKKNNCSICLTIHLSSEFYLYTRLINTDV